MSDYKSTGITNLVRHTSGNYYAQAKIEGKKVRVSLRTKAKDVARYRLAERLEQEKCKARGALSIKSLAGKISEGTWSALVGEWVASQRRRPELRENSVIYYERLAVYLLEGFPGGLLIVKLTPLQAAEWWSRVARARPARVANNLLAAARGVVALADAWGLRGGAPNPFANLGRVPIPQSDLVVPSWEEMESLLRSIRQVGKSHSEESVDFVEFLAYTGMRVGEAAAVTWSEVMDQEIRVTGGAKGTKGKRSRTVPLMPRVVLLLERRRSSGSKGRVFAIKSPREALNNACARVEIPHLRVHDLRHYFATHCLEMGVDIPTVAKWLGHRDGGVLVMKTYGHIRDEHSLEMIKKLG